MLCIQCVIIRDNFHTKMCLFKQRVLTALSNYFLKMSKQTYYFRIVALIYYLNRVEIKSNFVTDNISPFLLTLAFSLTLRNFTGMVSQEMFTREEATNSPFMLFFVSKYSTRQKRTLLLSVSVPEIKVSIFGGIIISISSIT